MFSKILFATVALALVSGPALADAGHGGARAYGEPGDARKPARTIAVTMRESDGKMMFIPSKIEVRHGEQIKFVLRNNAEIDHEIVLATLAENLKHGAEMQKNPDMEHDDPNAIRLAPGKSGEIIWKFSRDGEFKFACLVPGHYDAGMHGDVTVANK